MKRLAKKLLAGYGVVLAVLVAASLWPRIEAIEKAAAGLSVPPARVMRLGIYTCVRALKTALPLAGCLGFTLALALTSGNPAEDPGRRAFAAKGKRLPAVLCLSLLTSAFAFVITDAIQLPVSSADWGGDYYTRLLEAGDEEKFLTPPLPPS